MKDSDQRSLYVSELEHDACGIGFVAHLKGKKSHEIVEDALTMLTNMEHRGATGSDPRTGDGAGILIQIPHRFLSEECNKAGFSLPDFGDYGVGMVFFPSDESKREQCRAILKQYVEKRGFRLLGFRKVPAEKQWVGKIAADAAPEIEQMFISPLEKMSPEVFERQLFILRRFVGHAINREVPGINDEFYFTSLSIKTIVYKGQFRTDQLRPYFPDLHDPRIVSALALVHSRFSTNTFPRWRLAQPFRYIAHNGEINTIRGNINWMKTKEAVMTSPYFKQEELEQLFPICDPSHSDSRNLDSMVELLVMSGRSLPHAMMMVIPEAWQENKLMDPDRRAFYEYHSTLSEPWDGPASICFTDGNIVGATLDRNGLRPSRYTVTRDDRLVMSSEAGALPIPPYNVREKGRLQPGRIFVADLTQGRIISDEELKQEICSRKPYGEWLKKYKVSLESLASKKPLFPQLSGENLIRTQKLFGVTSEEIKVIIGKFAETANEPLGSMGTDTPLAVLSSHSQHISHYFKQLFAQVSNPPIDPIRERLVMSLRTWIGGSKNILLESEEGCKHITIKQPVLTNQELEKIRQIDHPDYRTITLDAVFGPGKSLKDALVSLCEKAEESARAAYEAEKRDRKYNLVIIISDRKAGKDHAPIPALMAVGAIHHWLMGRGLRSFADLIAETGDARETHHFATLIGYGAIAINPYLAFESITNLQQTHPDFQSYAEEKLHMNFIKGINYGLLKIFSKMGISTLESYHGAQIFEILGIASDVVDFCFKGSISRIGGLSFDELSREVLMRYEQAYPENPNLKLRLETGGLYQWKKDGEVHLFNPETIHLLQKSSKSNDYTLYKKYAARINEQMKKPITLRSLLDFAESQPVPLEEVESVESILKRFATGAMSFGSISHEAHSTLAIAMNRIGGKSNCGEGGEDEERYTRLPNGDSARSAIKQVASGRFGVTSYYLSQADELQIKMAQGAKPGEGGQLPGHKVDEWIGRVRHSTPGVGLISPPPHHDIYSIEDLAQLIFDLKNANRHARISVKLVSEAGVGTIAAGVSKAHADHILISGHDGGTGASPLSSIRHAGLPWELGLAEAHQTLVKNNLRSRVTLQVDGQIRTGRDMAIATLLGAEEWGIATAALVVEGCIMMRKCHLNTCPVGVATQNPELRAMFTGSADDLVNFFTFLAHDLREHMAALGFRTVNEMVGQSQMLRVREDIDHWKLRTIDLSPVLYKAPHAEDVGLYKQVGQDHGLEKVLDWQLLAASKNGISHGVPVFHATDVRNVDRAVGSIVSHEISKVHKGKGLAPGTLHYKFTGSAGQSFAAFGARGIRFELEGEANDYVGKGLSGAQVIVYPHKSTPIEPGKNIIIGNVAFYGATSGEAFIRGVAGERFCVRNSGVKAVVEGVGDHGCEYMTGGVVVVLGKTGRNFAAGMSGGIAYVYDPEGELKPKCNQELVVFDPLEYDDTETIKNLVSRHYTYTGSRIALKLMTDWPAAFDHFVKVIPTDYKKILLENQVKVWARKETEKLVG
ncbi:MAG: glutamate synthase large subunit [Bacteroidia bacterium]